MFFIYNAELKNCRRLFLRNYEVLINIGVLESEKKNEQRLLINVDIFIPFIFSSPKEDLLEEVVDYDFIRNTITLCVTKKHINLQETLCDSIVTTILQHKKVFAVRVSTEKPDVYPNCDSIGVEIFHMKNMF